MADKLEIHVLDGGNRPLDIRVGGQQPYSDAAATQTGRPEGRVVQWGQPEASHVRVYLGRDAYSQMMAHARSGVHGGQKVEIGGILLGRPYQDASGEIAHVVIDQALPDEHGISNPATFNFTHESWAALIKEAETQFPHLRIVGWYHSHPNYGIFYSGTDERSQKIYFATPWRVGIVVDPIRDEGGFFAVSPQTGEVVRLPGFFEPVGQNGRSWVTWRNWERSSKLLRNPTPPAGRVPPGSPAKPDRSHTPSKSSLQDWLPKNSMFLVMLVALLLFGLVWFILFQINNELQETRATVQALTGQDSGKGKATKTSIAPSRQHGTPLLPGLNPSNGKKTATPAAKTPAQTQVPPPTATMPVKATDTPLPPTPTKSSFPSNPFAPP